MNNWKDHIMSDPAILIGKPVIRDTRISVEIILKKVSEGETIDQILESYPHITRENILACFSYAKDALIHEVI